MKYLSRRILLLGTVLILTLIPIGCGGAAPEGSPLPTLQSIPTAVPTNTIAAPPTATPTSTPAPEPTQIPTATTIVVIEPTPEPTSEPTPEPTEAVQEATTDGVSDDDSNSVADAPVTQQGLSEPMSAALASLADKLIYLIHFDSKTKSWSVYDPTGSFVLEDLEPILMGPMPKSVESLTDIAINQPAYVKISAEAVFMGRALTEGYNLIVWKP